MQILRTYNLPAALIPLPASVSRRDQIENAEAYATRRAGRCLVLADDDQLRGGAMLAKACEDLASTLRNSRHAAGRERVHAAAARIAQIAVDAARPRRRG